MAGAGFIYIYHGFGEISRIGWHYNSLGIRVHHLGGTREKQQMPGILDVLQTQRRDLEKGRYHPRKDGRRERGLPCRSTPMVVVVAILCLFFFAYTRHSYHTQIARLKEQLAIIQGRIPKFAIVTFETRRVSYWKESLENKFRYARRHG